MKTYLKGAGLSTELLGVGIRQYRSPADAHGAFVALRTTMKTCRKDTIGGEQATYALVNIPQAGDGSIAIRIETAGATILQGFAVAGAALIHVGNGGAVNADGDVVSRYLGRQVSRYLATAAR
ncbi:MAG: hypothetical protein ABJA87_13115 [bacterium]